MTINAPCAFIVPKKKFDSLSFEPPGVLVFIGVISFVVGNPNRLCKLLGICIVFMQN